MQHRNVFISGATGLVGGALARHCVARGYRVVVLVRADVPAACALAVDGTVHHCIVHRGTINDADAVEQLLRTYEIDTVLHLAARSVLGNPLTTPTRTLETNVAGTWSVLEAARRSGVRSVVAASSVQVYGVQALGRPVHESDPLSGGGLYAASKAAADIVARAFWDEAALPVAVVRMGNVYGPGDLRLTRLVPASVTAVLQGRPPVLHADGQSYRDMVFVDDVASAYLAVADALHHDPGVGGVAFNVGHSAHTLLDVVQCIVAIAGSTGDASVGGAPSIGPSAPHGLDCTRIKELTGWFPRVDLDDGLRRTLAWYENHLGLVLGSETLDPSG